jgi:MerR family transcriptional regulator, repressor of the yfmOP operon
VAAGVTGVDVAPRRAGAGMRIGEAAARAAVSPRTLRYYEELGLLSPSGRSPGGNRRYSEADVERVLRIRELKDLMGFDLDHIRAVVGAEARLGELREQYLSGADAARRRELLLEAIEINDRLRGGVRDKLARTQEFLAGLEAKAARYREVLVELKP